MLIIGERFCSSTSIHLAFPRGAPRGLQWLPDLGQQQKEDVELCSEWDVAMVRNCEPRAETPALKAWGATAVEILLHHSLIIRKGIGQ
jgi:hypothetical protein